MCGRWQFARFLTTEKLTRNARFRPLSVEAWSDTAALNNDAPTSSAIRGARRRRPVFTNIINNVLIGLRSG